MAGAQAIFIAAGVNVYCRSQALAGDIERLNHAFGGLRYDGRRRTPCPARLSKAEKIHDEKMSSAPLPTSDTGGTAGAAVSGQKLRRSLSGNVRFALNSEVPLYLERHSVVHPLHDVGRSGDDVLGCHCFGEPAHGQRRQQPSARSSRLQALMLPTREPVERKASRTAATSCLRCWRKR
jgi:hypothetical protein